MAGPSRPTDTDIDDMGKLLTRRPTDFSGVHRVW